ncbi:hypothetical protein [Streptomyces sp. NPDC048639]|uniref:hypothetical protein n=1 Tax=Streptomyces sp. NPDC048639 TaxID=3365581 RepID=UPI0037108105
MNGYSTIKRGPMAADRFTQIANDLFRDPRVTLKAKGLFGLISTHRDGYGVTPKSLSRDTKDSVDAIKTGLQELERHGYLYRARERLANGRLGTSTYFITDQPTQQPPPEEPVRQAPHPVPPPATTALPNHGGNSRSQPEWDFPSLEKPALENPPPKNTNLKNTNSQNTNGAPSARSAGERRRLSTGSSARKPESCAPNNHVTQLPRKAAWQGAPRRLPVTLTADQAMVFAAFPVVLREAMRRTTGREVPKTLLDTITIQLRDRTALQLRDRVVRRWESQGYRTKFEAGALNRPVGAAVTMLRHGRCPDLSCEDGAQIDTGAPCRACVERRATRPGRPKSEAGSGPCPACTHDRGTSGALCEACRAPFQRRVTDAVNRAEQAAHTRHALDADRAVHAARARGEVLRAAEEARATARSQGAEELGVLLAAQWAAEQAADAFARTSGGVMLGQALQ